MLKRKIRSYIYEHLASKNSKILVIDGARQIGKSYIIREVAKSLFQNYVEINFAEDKNGPRLFESATTKEEFYFRLSTVVGDRLKGTKEDTIIFLDGIQTYPHLLTLLKFLKEDGRYTYIASGSLLGVTLRRTTSVPAGSVIIKHMFQLDFEEFLWANGFTEEAVSALEEKFRKRESLDESMHARIMDLFKKYLLVGGLPDAVNEFLSSRNIMAVRDIHEAIHTLYGIDAAQYDEEHKLKISRIYDMIPSLMGNKKKRIVYRDVEGKINKRNEDYQDEFDYVSGAGIAIEVKAVSSPVFPLKESESKNLLKFYMNDVGLLTNELYKYNIDAVMNDRLSVNLGSVYESVVASELRAHCLGQLYYYDNKAHGEVEFLLDDYDNAALLPVEVKSGKDYTIHRALNAFLANPDYHVHDAFVLSNERLIKKDRFITYIPIYYAPFIQSSHPDVVTL
ncbi:MAG: ATP-binding protein [Bacteroidales bacterium]|nr:ATP-binding protein [Bacteroidales bacterium]